MVIQCPYCATRFQLDESRLTSSHPMLKCSRCRHIFPGPTRTPPAPSQRPPEPTASPAPASPAPPENLSFSFSEQPLKEPAADLTIDEPEPEYELGTEPEPPPRAPGAPRRSPEPLQRFDEEDSDPVVHDAGPEATAAEPEEEPAEAVEEPREEEPDMSRGISVRPVFIFLALVVTAYGAISWTLRSNAQLADALLRKVPFTSLTEDRLLNRKIVLADVTGGYQRIKDGQTVFVITGRAINNAPVTVRSIQVMGRLFDGTKSQLDEKTIFCGNVISMKILKSLTQREVSILQDLKPPKRFGIAPGEDSTFVIVFMQPPKGVTEFSSQVIAAQRQA